MFVGSPRPILNTGTFSSQIISRYDEVIDGGIFIGIFDELDDSPNSFLKLSKYHCTDATSLFPSSGGARRILTPKGFWVLDLIFKIAYLS